MPLVSVIVVNYNGLNLLGDCLESLKGQVFRDFELIVVDNASTDGSVRFLRDNYPEVKVVENPANLGYGAAINAGIGISKGEYIVVLNNDTKADPRWLEKLLSAAGEDKDAGMWASKIMNYHSPGIIDNTGLLMYRDGLARGRGRLEKDREFAEEVFFPSGCAGLYKRQMLDEIGLFDEDFFLYLDDVDIGLRARLAGWKCVYVPDAVVYHKYSATVKEHSLLKAYHVERNRIWIMLKYFPLRMIAVSPLYTLWRYALHGYGILAGRGAGSRLVRSESVFKPLKILLKSYLSALRGSGRMLQKRRQIKELRKASDKDISEWFRKFGVSAGEVALKE